MAILGKFLTVSEAAALLGVSRSTIRNWDRSGKVQAVRHPVNNYRLFPRDELEALLSRLSPDQDRTSRITDEIHG
jgi:excisionase family DNA binding protein